MNIFNSGNEQKDNEYNMVGRSNTTYANDIANDNIEYRPSSYNMQTSQDEDQRSQLEDIQRRLGAFSTNTVEEQASDSVDIMPSASTMNLSYNRQYAVGNTVSTSVALSTKTKIAIASYVLVTLVLVALIAVCSLTVGGSFAKIASTEVSYNEALSELGVLEAATASVSYEQMLASAEALGYSAVDGTNSLEYTVLQTRPAQNYNISTNWFDGLCDWVSGAFGG